MEILPAIVIACVFAQFPFGLLVGIAIGIRIAGGQRTTKKSAPEKVKTGGLFVRNREAEPEPTD
jgi:hypothetical protein